MPTASSDVIVVGGGPAGSVTALLLARAGYHVKLLERAAFPRAKPCGDCISPGANSILKRLGVWPDLLRERPALLRGWRLVSGTHGFSAAFQAVPAPEREEIALALERSRFDAVLLRHARLSGVQVCENTRVLDLLRDARNAVIGVSAKHNGEAQSHYARLTIGADGLRSVVARRLHAYARLPRLRKASFTLHAPLSRASDLGELRLLAHGCVGLAPVAAGGDCALHNVTLVLGSQACQPRLGARTLVNHALARFPDLRDAAGDAAILTSGPFDWPVRRTVFDGAVLVGDAAGYYDPFTGQGIFQALAGGELLAQHAAQALRTPNVTAGALRGYGRAQRRLSSASRRVQQLVEFVCARPQLAERAFARLARADALTAALIGVTGDLLPARALFSPRFLAQMMS